MRNRHLKDTHGSGGAWIARQRLIATAAFATAGLLLLGCSNNSPTRNTAEMTREVRCREEARRYCEKTTSSEADAGYDRNKCIGDRAWNCIMGQTPADMRERYAPAAPAAD